MAAILRQASRADVGEMHDVRMSVVENRLTSIVLTEADYIEAIEQRGRGWVVEVDRRIVAFAVGNASEGLVWALFVRPEHEGQGYGRRLHDAMLAWLWDRGLEKLRLTTQPGTRAETFYAAAGWRRAGTTPSGELLLEMICPRASSDS